MSRIFKEENEIYCIDCTKAVWATDKLNSIYHEAKIHLKMWDFIIESEEFLILVEYKFEKERASPKHQQGAQNQAVQRAAKKDIEKERSTASIGNLISENIASPSEQSQTFGFGDYHRMLCKLIGKIAFRRIGLQL